MRLELEVQRNGEVEMGCNCVDEMYAPSCKWRRKHRLRHGHVCRKCRHCMLCHVTMNSSAQAWEHFGGRKHRMSVYRAREKTIRSAARSMSFREWVDWYSDNNSRRSSRVQDKSINAQRVRGFALPDVLYWERKHIVDVWDMVERSVHGSCTAQDAWYQVMGDTEAMDFKLRPLRVLEEATTSLSMWNNVVAAFTNVCNTQLRELYRLRNAGKFYHLYHPHTRTNNERSWLVLEKAMRTLDTFVQNHSHRNGGSLMEGQTPTETWATQQALRTVHQVLQGVAMHRHSRTEFVRSGALPEWHIADKALNHQPCTLFV